MKELTLNLLFLGFSLTRSCYSTLKACLFYWTKSIRCSTNLLYTFLRDLIKKFTNILSDLRQN